MSAAGIAVLSATLIKARKIPNKRTVTRPG